MAKDVIQKDILGEVSQITPYLLQFPYERLWIDYDKNADVLYINFKRPQRATDSEMLDNGILLRYRKNELVGVTVLDASKQKRHR
ncbi:MAG: DUF2283 domain-containing protein [Ignavibacteriales bacterium]|nr:DUF2283 domain-containing protein [Ignavibacteriales bacterium]